MANCANCGEVNPETNAFCSRCGQPLEKPEEKSAAEVALDNAQKEFENDAKISADKSKLTYICELCGTINRIENGACSKCGKPRPRSEYIRALANFKNAKEEAQSMLAEKAAAEKAAAEKAAAQAAAEQAATEKVAAEKAAAEKAASEKSTKEATNNSTIQAPMQEYVEGTNESVVRGAAAPAVAPMGAPMGQQNGSVVQPFVIVPYVDSNQKLWQYQPRQVYKFEPYSAEERDLRSQKANAYRNGADPTMEELQRMRERRTNEINSLNDAIDAKLPDDQKLVNINLKKDKIGRTATCTVVFSLLMMVALLFFSVMKSATFAISDGIDAIKFLGNCLEGEGIARLGIGISTCQYNGVSNFILPISYIIMAILDVAIFAQGVNRLRGRKTSTRGFVMPLICFLLCIATFISFMAFSTGKFDGSTILNELKNISYGFYVVTACSLAMTIIGLCTPINTNK